MWKNKKMLLMVGAVLAALAVDWAFPLGWREIWPKRIEAFKACLK